MESRHLWTEHETARFIFFIQKAYHLDATSKYAEVGLFYDPTAHKNTSWSASLVATATVPLYIRWRLYGSSLLQV